MHTMKLMAMASTLFLVIGITWATLATVYGVLKGTAHTNPPTLYPESDETLNVNTQGSGTYAITSNTSQAFTHTLDTSKDFYPMQALVYLDTTGSVTTVAFDYGNGTYTICSQRPDHYACPVTNQSIEVDTFRLKLTAGSNTVELDLGNDTRVEVKEA